jgi:hypothetical protein
MFVHTVSLAKKQPFLIKPYFSFGQGSFLFFLVESQTNLANKMLKVPSTFAKCREVWKSHFLKQTEL